jgi:hypothetical protein
MTTNATIPQKVARRRLSLLQFDPELRERHIKADFSGELVAIDTFMVGNLKVSGKSTSKPLLTAIHVLLGGHLYTSKVPVSAVNLFP